jgi:hypothetical protein
MPFSSVPQKLSLDCSTRAAAAPRRVALVQTVGDVLVGAVHLLIDHARERLAGAPLVLLGERRALLFRLGLLEHAVDGVLVGADAVGGLVELDGPGLDVPLGVVRDQQGLAEVLVVVGHLVGDQSP